ncbi:FeoA family protein [Allochromatium palmeri]|uniref:FeoA family protein n=1 Tax=Allochromatium palmeri TaxID=231048 RepID=UPI001FE3BCAB|nr:ferrous iron transport protein A [Allochromatium palmeri]
MSQTSDPLRLSDLPDDTPAQLAAIRGGRHLTRRLLALGLRQGSPLCIVQRRGKGLVLASGELRIAIGTGIADKLWVTLVDDPVAVETSDVASNVHARPGDEAA